MHDAELDVGLGEDRSDGVDEAGEVVDGGDEDVLDAAGLEVGEDAHPEFCRFVLAYVQAKYVAITLLVDAERACGWLIPYTAFEITLPSSRTL